LSSAIRATGNRGSQFRKQGTHKARQQHKSNKGDPTMSWQITVHIKQHFISCTPKGGNVKGKGSDQFRWFSPDAPFKLIFTIFPNGQPVWPFKEPQPNWPVTDTGLLTIVNGNPPKYYKYTVQSAGCPDLDPIIIID
jgi:hypothetical protein